MKIQENIPLAPLTTFHIGGPARYFVEAQTETEVKEAVRYAAEHKLPLFVLGGGSNVLIADEGWPGLMLKVSLPGVEFDNASSDVIFYAGAGENWDDFVALTISKDCAGLECLSGIPGTVGGTPVQNVGAYGQEVSQTILRVRVLEIATSEIQELTNAECGFSYRSSIFNASQRGRYIVLEVTYRLRQGGDATAAYGDVKKFFSGVSRKPTLHEVRDAVRAIRLSKAMLLVRADANSRSAGSFFKNPLVTVAEADRIQAHAERQGVVKTMPRFAAENGMVKIAAAWLVEYAGFRKGYALGQAGISRKHSLAIVNRGGAKACDIIALKDAIQKKVFDVWGVHLEPEPVFVGFAQSSGMSGK